MHKNQDIFEELSIHLMTDEKPSLFLSEIVRDEAFGEYPLNMLSDLVKVEQSPVHHPEGSVWKHTLLVVDEAAIRRQQSEDKQAFMWAALLHDIGKKETSRVRNGKITAYDHDRVGANMAVDFLREFGMDERFIHKVFVLVKWHMQLLHVVNNAKFAKVEQMKSEVSIEEIALLGLCDRLGRGKANRKKEQENVRIFLQKGNSH